MSPTDHLRSRLDGALISVYREPCRDATRGPRQLANSVATARSWSVGTARAGICTSSAPRQPRRSPALNDLFARATVLETVQHRSRPCGPAEPDHDTIDDLTLQWIRRIGSGCEGRVFDSVQNRSSQTPWHKG